MMAEIPLLEEAATPAGCAESGGPWPSTPESNSLTSDEPVTFTGGSIVHKKKKKPPRNSRKCKQEFATGKYVIKGTTLHLV